MFKQKKKNVWGLNPKKLFFYKFFIQKIIETTKGRYYCVFYENEMYFDNFPWINSTFNTIMKWNIEIRLERKEIEGERVIS